MMRRHELLGLETQMLFARLETQMLFACLEYLSMSTFMIPLLRYYPESYWLFFFGECAMEHSVWNLIFIKARS